MRGFTVHLYERAPHLGGRLREASVPDYKYRISELIQWYERQLAASGVQIHLSISDTEKEIARLKPNAIVVATGAIPLRLPVPGIEHTKEALAVLMGEAGDIGQIVVIIGGGLIGCETAYVLAKQGKTVCVVEMLDKPLMLESIFVKRTMLKELEALGVTFRLESRVTRITDGGLEISRPSGCDQVIANTVVLAAGMRSDQSLWDTVSALADEVYWIGDAKSAGKIINATMEGHRLAIEM